MNELTKYYVWIGIRKSDTIYSKLINNSITTFGDNNDGNHSYCCEKNIRVRHRNLDDELIYIKEKIEYFIKIYKNVKFIFYDQSEIEYYKEFKNFFINVNPKELIELLSSKLQSKIWLNNYTNIIPFLALPIGLIELNKIQKAFPGVEAWILQLEYGNSGNGTFVINNEDDINILKQKFNKWQLFIIMPYISNALNINQTVFIKNGEIVIFQPSEQLSKNNDNIHYSGNIFYKEKQYYEEYIEKETYKIAKILKKIGYNGIFGIDYLIKNNNIYAVEINPRFQGSTVLINTALSNEKLPSLEDCYIENYNNVLKLNELKRFDGKINYMYSNETTVSNDKHILCDGWSSKIKAVEYDCYAYKEITFNGMLFRL